MPTQRLSDSDKSYISSRFDQVLFRAGNNLTFPLQTKEEVVEWVVDCMPKHIRKPYQALKQNAPTLIRDGGWSNRLDIRNENDEQYELEFDGITGWPNWRAFITPEHEHFDDVWQWCQDMHTIKGKVKRAERYKDNAIEACTSAGQIARIFPQDILRFLPPNTLNSLGDAERKSRVPRGFTIDPEMTELVANMMAIGSVCPDERPDIAPDIIKFTGLAAKE
jgi:hypothetical protein